MAGAKTPITFRIFKGDKFIREETLSQPVIKVGKLSSSHLRLDDDTVSRMHAVIEVTGPGDVSIIDLGSTKGTHVNGQKVNKAKLQSGDQIIVGDTRIEIAIGDGAQQDDDAPTRVNIKPSDSAVMASSPRPASEPIAPPVAAAMPTPMAPPSPPPMMSSPPQMGAPAAPAAPPMPAAASVPAPPPMAAPSRPAMSGMPAPMAMQAPGLQANFGMDSVDDIGGARAVEVAAMLGDSVVGVKHVMNPRSGKVTTTTYAMFAGGAAMLLMSAIAFGVGVSNAKFNKAAKHQWTTEMNKPAWEFRPRRLSLGYDWMAFGGAAAGLFAMTMGLIRLREERQTPFFRIGNSPDVEFPTETAPSPTFPLVAPLGDDFVFNYTSGMEGEINVDGQSMSLTDFQAQGRARPSTTAPGAFEFAIPHKARIKVRSGNNTFLVSSVPRPRRQAVPLFASVESTALTFFAGSALGHALILILLFSLPKDPRSLALDLGSSEGRLTRVESKAQEDPKQEEEELEKNSDDESGGTGTAMALDEGKMGKEDSKRKTGQYKMKDEGSENPQLAKQKAIDAARNAGFLGSLKTQQGGAFASLTGTGDFSSGLDDSNIYGGLLGNEAGEMQGGFGFGRSGFGPGGGGTGWGTIGTGRYGTIGHGSGTGSGYGVGSGRGGMGGRRATVPDVRIGNATATGDLDKNIIRRYIRQKLPRIKYCYEKQLIVKQGLSGTVATQFTISPQGTVLNASGSGVDPEVASCVAGVIKTIRFPKPKGGGLVQVRYPFTFRPTGG